MASYHLTGHTSSIVLTSRERASTSNSATWAHLDLDSMLYGAPAPRPIRQFIASIVIGVGKFEYVGRANVPGSDGKLRYGRSGYCSEFDRFSAWSGCEQYALLDLKLRHGAMMVLMATLLDV